MDLHTVTAIRPARTRSDLAVLGGSTAVLAGGSWLYSEPSIHLTALVDITTLGWPSTTVTTLTTETSGEPTTGKPRPGGLSIAATCTLAEISRLDAQPGWNAHPLFFQCCTALVGSFKVWNVATVGGNLCTALPAGPMISLTAALDGQVVIWRSDGTDSTVAVVDFVTGDHATVLGGGDVLRSVEIPTYALAARTAYRKIALSAYGRSGAVIIGRRDADDAFVLTITAATLRPVQLRYAELPAPKVLATDVSAVTAWFTDAHGAADWRRAVSGVLAQEILAELTDEHQP